MTRGDLFTGEISIIKTHVWLPEVGWGLGEFGEGGWSG